MVSANRKMVMNSCRKSFTSTVVKADAGVDVETGKYAGLVKARTNKEMMTRLTLHETYLVFDSGKSKLPAFKGLWREGSLRVMSW
jgi:hypothetical protein